MKLNKIMRKILVATMGITVLFFGLLAIVLPGPAIIIIPLGLIILASEFYFIRKFLRPINKKILNYFRRKSGENSRICTKLKKLQKMLDKKQN